MTVFSKYSVAASFSFLSGPVVFQVNLFLTLESLFHLLSNQEKKYITFFIYLRKEFAAVVQQGGYLLVVFFHGVIILGSRFAANFASSCGCFFSFFSF